MDPTSEVRRPSGRRSETRRSAPMAKRTPLVAANWKMHKTVAETEAFLDAFVPRAAELRGAELVVCPPYPSLAPAVARCAGSGVRVAAQNMHEEPQGAFTGEVAAPMLTELGVDGVILGHSERRFLFGESDESLARKVPAALEAGLTPILCVGETEGERDANQTEAVLRRQLDADLAKASDGRLAEVVIAYEPEWAIGTGGNAISQASTPVFDRLWDRYPHTTLSASGRDVGLPDGQMGNSEVGHLNLGAGSIVAQDLTRIDEAIADGSFFENPVLKGACEA